MLQWIATVLFSGAGMVHSTCHTVIPSLTTTEQIYSVMVEWIEMNQKMFTLKKHFTTLSTKKLQNCLVCFCSCLQSHRFLNTLNYSIAKIPFNKSWQPYLTPFSVISGMEDQLLRYILEQRNTELSCQTCISMTFHRFLFLKFK